MLFRRTSLNYVGNHTTSRLRIPEIEGRQGRRMAFQDGDRGEPSCEISRKTPGTCRSARSGQAAPERGRASIRQMILCPGSVRWSQARRP